MKKYFSFGLGAGLSLILIALLIYGYVWVSTRGNQANGEVLTDKSPGLAAEKAEALFINYAGKEIGRAVLEESENGVLIKLKVSALPPGELAIHIHEKGQCTPVERAGGPSPQNYFSDAGSHFNPHDHEHGLMHEEGPHAGDLPNIFVTREGVAEAHIFNDRVTLSEEDDTDRAGLFDDDGSALIIHAGADDYHSQPTGQAGDRVACAVITKE